MQVTHAESSDIPKLAILFDQYRIFYKQKDDLVKATDFLNSRFKNKDSVILVAHENLNIIGFTQLYPSFSSVGMEKIWILNDLFVSSDFRNQNVAKYLMEAAKKHGEETGALRIELATQASNSIAQNLYESMGYIKNEEFWHYSLEL
ncbi:MAG: GNAT family N-acetyltransferase [Nitrospina sp.]|jgi:ribosomal protein S18 acetylase RimI-like enzyme|nr:GNAT family N-acetyltransferase [Nitrospina sp.]MBT5632472.1 GNAT family N-acetyltransferase [Nitrospina sp.]